jgi:hypothetical protein
VAAAAVAAAAVAAAAAATTAVAVAVAARVARLHRQSKSPRVRGWRGFVWGHAGSEGRAVSRELSACPTATQCGALSLGSQSPDGGVRGRVRAYVRAYARMCARAGRGARGVGG